MNINKIMSNIPISQLFPKPDVSPDFTYLSSSKTDMLEVLQVLPPKVDVKKPSVKRNKKEAPPLDIGGEGFFINYLPSPYEAVDIVEPNGEIKRVITVSLPRVIS